MRALFVALLLVITANLLPRSAQAEEQQIQILTVFSNDALQNAVALTEALKRAAAHVDGWKPAAGDVSLEVLMAGLGCTEPNSSCLRKIAKEIDVDRYIWGTLEPVDDEVVAHLYYWEDGQNVRDTRLTYSESLTDGADDTLFDLAESAFYTLVGITTGQLVVLAGDVDGEVFVDGASVGRIKNGRAEIQVPSGKVEVVVKAPGYEDARSTVKVRTGASARVVLEPIPLESNRKGFRIARRATSPEPDSRRHKPRSAQRLVGYGVLGAGVAASVVGAVFWVQSATQRNDEDYQDFRDEVLPTEDPCVVAEARGRNDIVDICDKNDTARTLAWILTPTGVALSTLGAVLVATGKPKDSAQRRLRPTVAIGPNAAQLELGYQF